MNRRTFMGVTAATGVAALSGEKVSAQPATQGRMIYELRTYIVESEAQKTALNDFLRDAAIPAYNRLGVQPIGVFQDEKELSPVYVVLPYPSYAVFDSAPEKLLADPEYVSKGAAFLDAPASAPAYKRVESSLLKAFSGMPKIESPTAVPGRVLQLRIYESPSAKTGQKKIEMFNTKEIAIFRKTGLNPVFFGEAVAGNKMPNLTYMLAFDSPEAKDAAWNAFRADPEWLELRARPEYDDKAILCGITNLLLKPMPASQI